MNFDYDIFKNKTVLVAWSGGIDSTALILKILEAGGAVKAVTFTGNLPNNDSQLELTDKLLKLPRLRKVTRRLISADPYLIAGWGSDFKRAQHGIWCGLLPLLTGGCDYVSLGYLMEEAMLCDQVADVYSAHEKNMHALPQLTFPLKELTKKESYWLLMEGLKEDLALYNKYHLNCSNLGRFTIREKYFDKLGLHCGCCEKCHEMKDAGVEKIVYLDDIYPNANNSLEVIKLLIGRGHIFERTDIDGSGCLLSLPISEERNIIIAHIDTCDMDSLKQIPLKKLSVAYIDHCKHIVLEDYIPFLTREMELRANKVMGVLAHASKIGLIDKRDNVGGIEITV